MAIIKFEKLRGIIGSIFQIGIGATAVNLKEAAGVLQARNKADSAFAQVASSGLLVQDANGQKVTIVVPDIAADYTLTLPIDDGSPNQVLATDGSGVTSWISAASTADKSANDTTTLAFGTASPLSLFATPAGAVLEAIRVIIDTAFNGAPQLSIGITGTTSKYAGTGDFDLTQPAGSVFDIPVSDPASAGEALIATYTQGAASAGSARILAKYCNPA